MCPNTVSLICTQFTSHVNHVNLLIHEEKFLIDHPQLMLASEYHLVNHDSPYLSKHHEISSHNVEWYDPGWFPLSIDPPSIFILHTPLKCRADAIFQWFPIRIPLRIRFLALYREAQDISHPVEYFDEREHHVEWLTRTTHFYIEIQFCYNSTSKEGWNVTSPGKWFPLQILITKFPSTLKLIRSTISSNLLMFSNQVLPIINSPV